MTNEFTAIVEPAEEGGFWAFCLEVPGANGQGDTIEETVENLREGIEFMLAYLREERSAEVSPAAERRVVTIPG
ncbi:MAG: type II toxin-antitoxin system HicB family antitoxin [Dehalococcoidia bacterium]|uniref:type II toxin-antitoxin system HicB family antitoxin n=1 Tax=Candidatus Amarobacter glycogenicus TaxID=3140699 RepID=UPI002A17245F|nr:type II toxin-antitoxin system HicB family antitoxin [Dehalococcoidia bacterium]MBK9613202.1 type II toxin-antitoxin system HicB family antitoxin [Dehalococcoidia bacterium]